MTEPGTLPEGIEHLIDATLTSVSVLYQTQQQRAFAAIRDSIRTAYEAGAAQERARILGPACPCACGQEPWHQRGVCREGEAVLMKSIATRTPPPPEAQE